MIRFCEGEKILANGRLCIIKRILTFDAIEVQDAETGVRKTVARWDVHKPLELSPPAIKVPQVITKEQELIRDLRYQVINHVLYRVRSESEIKACCLSAVQAGLLAKGDPSTIYDWIRRYEASDDRNSLVPPLRPTGGRGKSRMDPERWDLMKAAIDGSFLTKNKKKPTAVYGDVELAFMRENKDRAKIGFGPLATPCKKTVLDYIKAIDPKLAEEKRYGKKSAKERFGIMEGHLECGEWPWHLGQMDHKLLRNVVVDDVTGEPLGQPWITVILDTNSRVPPAWVLSLKKPTAATIGFCFAMSMIPKSHWLKGWKMNDEEFPVFGKWRTVQADNELINEAYSIIEGCHRSKIHLEFRPLRNPETGAFIESFFDTIDTELRNLPGYKFKNRKNHENYSAEKDASLTLSKLAEAIAIIIIRIYCNRKHSSLQDSPLNVYKRNLMESGIGIPEMLLEDEARDMILKFMPYEVRTVQEYGVQMFNMHYRNEALQEYIKVGKEVR